MIDTFISQLDAIGTKSLLSKILPAYDLTMMAMEASGHGLHDAATVFLEAATKKAREEEKSKTDLVEFLE